MSNIQDQWFEPGDKVMRVSNVIVDPRLPIRIATDMTKVYCVQAFRKQICCGRNSMLLAGTTGWVRCHNFRKVEEIRLCVEAAAKMKQPSRKEVEA